MRGGEKGSGWRKESQGMENYFRKTKKSELKKNFLPSSQ